MPICAFVPCVATRFFLRVWWCGDAARLFGIGVYTVVISRWRMGMVFVQIKPLSVVYPYSRAKRLFGGFPLFVDFEFSYTII